jgi:hypothetical protein
MNGTEERDHVTGQPADAEPCLRLGVRTLITDRPTDRPRQVPEIPGQR